MTRRGKIVAALTSAFAIFALSGIGWSGAAGAADSPPPTQLKMTAATLGERSLMTGTRAVPVVINPQERQKLSVTVRNDGNTPVAVRYLRLTGSVLGVHFVHYQGSANVDV